MARRVQRQVAALLFLAFALASQTTGPALTPEQQAVVSHVTPDSMRGHVSFLASDLLEGRSTPSRGLDLAAEYIAAQFRRAGLEPAGDDGYFQTATLRVFEPDYQGFKAAAQLADGATLDLSSENLRLLPRTALSLSSIPFLLVEESTEVNAAQVNGSVVAVTTPQALRKIEKMEPRFTLLATSTLPRLTVTMPGQPPPVERIGYIAQPELISRLRGTQGARISIEMAAVRERPVAARNVAGIVRGSDPQLRDTYVMLTSHYDHVGIGGPSNAGDRIFNGANDDASGSSGVMEVAAALAALPVHPKRSVLFVTFFGEEGGFFGSRYYAQHPLAPPAKTVADLNLEQIGRTDAADGAQIKTASITGFDFSAAPSVIAEAALLAGVRVYKNPANSDAFFGRSDNLPLAQLGIPAHTLCVAYEFPDYHKVSDTWDKIDYDNMAAVTRAIALGIMRLASDAAPPKWNESHEPARRYVEAAKKLGR